jgi:hypothetical protein
MSNIRRQRRHFERQLPELFQRDDCSICGNDFRHNSSTTGGLDSQGNVVLACEDCANRVATIFTKGFYSKRQYDFLQQGTGSSGPRADLTAEQIDTAIGLYKNIISAADKVADDILRPGGHTTFTPQFNLHDPAWKADDAEWFKNNPSRAHRARRPLPGEINDTIAKPPPGSKQMMLIRQVSPGYRMKILAQLSVGLLPLVDSEAGAHALFEVMAGREEMPDDPAALDALIQKYSTPGSA